MMERPNKAKIGPCNVHAETCHGLSGLFILEKQCVVVVLLEGRVADMVAPYLDSHGEADPHLRRGRPLALNRKRYHQVRDLWVTHKLHVPISQKLEGGAPDADWSTL